MTGKVVRGVAYVRENPEGGWNVSAPGSVVPPGYDFNLSVPLAALEHGYETVEYEVRPAPGLRARWLRWRYPGEPK